MAVSTRRGSGLGVQRLVRLFDCCIKVDWKLSDLLGESPSRSDLIGALSKGGDDADESSSLMIRERGQIQSADWPRDRVLFENFCSSRVLCRTLLKLSQNGFKRGVPDPRFRVS